MLPPEIRIYVKHTTPQLIEDNERKILFCNEAFTRLFDIKQSSEELIGTNCIDLLISLSNNIPDVERLSAFVATSLSDRLPSKVYDIKINPRTIIYIDYKSAVLKNDVLIHVWEYTSMH
jgi:hypothetical protein